MRKHKLFCHFFPKAEKKLHNLGKYIEGYTCPCKPRLIPMDYEQCGAVIEHYSIREDGWVK